MLRALACVLIVAMLAACASGKVSPGYYRVRSGDTLSQIARENDRSVAELMRWNGLSNSNRLEVGQLLRVVPPGSTSTAAASRDTKDTRSAARARAGKGGAAAADDSDTSPAGAASAGPGIALSWPASGKLQRRFGGASHGLTIVDAAGTPVVAAAAGTVAYASNGLRGYGNLIIVRHNANFLTIYAHNRKLLVKQGQAVAQNQKIAEMGDSDSAAVELYFEVRRNGKAVDPLQFLPSR
jgi:murein DD-endopeptidase MepM/ murein hydrolase activator NlpD